MRVGTSGLLCLAAILTNDLNEPNDVVIQLFQLFGRNPPLRVVVATNLLNFIATHKRTANRKPSDVPNTIVFDVPSTRDLDCVPFIRDRVEDRLLRQSRWPSTKPTELQKFSVP